MKIRFLSILLLFSLSLNAFSATMTIHNKTNLTHGQWWDVEVNTDSLVSGWIRGDYDIHVLEWTFPSGDKYKVTSIKYCLNRSQGGCDRMESYKSCVVQDNTTGSVNQVNAQVNVTLNPDDTCYATINPGKIL